MSGRDGHRIDNHAALTALDAVHFLGLAIDRHVAVNDADAALLRQGNGQVRLGHGIHRGAENRNIESDFSCQAGSRIGFGRQHIAERRLKNQIIEGESLRDARSDHGDKFITPSQKVKVKKPGINTAPRSDSTTPIRHCSAPRARNTSARPARRVVADTRIRRPACPAPIYRCRWHRGSGAPSRSRPVPCAFTRMV